MRQAAEGDRAAGRVRFQLQKPHGGAFAGTVRSEQTEHFAVVHTEGDALHSHDATSVVLPAVVDGDGVRGAPVPGTLVIHAAELGGHVGVGEHLVGDAAVARLERVDEVAAHLRQREQREGYHHVHGEHHERRAAGGVVEVLDAALPVDEDVPRVRRRERLQHREPGVLQAHDARALERAQDEQQEQRDEEEYHQQREVELDVRAELAAAGGRQQGVRVQEHGDAVEERAEAVAHEGGAPARRVVVRADVPGGEADDDADGEHEAGQCVEQEVAEPVPCLSQPVDLHGVQHTAAHLAVQRDQDRQGLQEDGEQQNEHRGPQLQRAP
mmetsp:Transcript_21348/g.66211  ORF Transcript_21348/g.66211 Transcript_21348/m.66211 type:complete len:326 (+) Transcript_21348:934-1911(+)